MNKIEIHFDGGCRPTNPGRKYGSYEVQLDAVTVCKVSRMEFGWGTNNEAEYDALIAALNWTTENLWRGGFDTRGFTVSVFTDSTIVANRISGRKPPGKSEPARRMAALTMECLDRLAVFKSFTIQWRRRDANVERFGH